MKTEFKTIRNIMKEFLAHGTMNYSRLEIYVKVTKALEIIEDEK